MITNQIVVADFHLDINNRPHDTIEVMKYVLNYGIEHKVRRIVIVGDVYEKCKPSPEEIYILHSWVKKAVLNGIKLLFIYGNHDTFKSKFFKGYHYSYKELELLYSKEWVQLENSGYVEDKIFYGHLLIDGTKTGSHGFKLSSSISATSLRNKYPQCNLFLLGHEHKHQEIEQGIYYIGSPQRQDFSERFDGKFFLHLTDRKQIHAPKNPEGYASHNVVGDYALYWIRTPARRMIEIVEDWTKKQYLKPDVAESEFENALVVLKIITTKEIKWIHDEEGIRERYAKAFKLQSIQYDYVDDNKPRNENISSNVSEVDCFKEYCKEKNLDSTVEKLGIKILKEAKKC